MSSLQLFNTLTRSIGDFAPLHPPQVSLYTCGPTVYDYQHIGNWRTFVFEDILRRVLELNKFRVTHVMNATDVGHLSGDNLGDADLGEDRIEKGAQREGKTVWEVAQFYLDDFIQTRGWLNILPPTHFIRATDYIKEQIELAQRLLEKGLAYETKTGIFFEVEKFPEYGKLSGQKLVDKRVATRKEVEKDQSKKSPHDFALWFKTVGKFAKHQMRWGSPWGEGFPGWHIECSAMAMALLGETIDIHTGGVDHIAIHHTNEIAQSEGATGREFARYWLHGEFLTVAGGRMGKSLGNAYSLHDIQNKGFDPLVLRYLYLTAHYRDKLNFTWESLESAQNALHNLRELVRGWEGPKIGCAEYEARFKEILDHDLNMPQALAVAWEMVKSDYPSSAKAQSLLMMDTILGLGLDEYIGKRIKVPEQVIKLVGEREKARKEGDFPKSDQLRCQINKLGFEVEDTPKGPKVRRG